MPIETKIPGASSRSQAEQVARSAGIVSLAVLASRLSGLLREIILARFFGAGFVYDAFLLGFRVPNLARDLFAEGALSSAFVPTFTQTLARRGRQAAAELSSLTASAILIVVGAFCALGAIFAPLIVELLAPGFHSIPGKFELAVHLTRIMFPFLLLVALAAQAMGILNSCDRYAVPALSSTAFNVGSLGLGLFLGFVIGRRIGLTPIEGISVGVVLGGALQLAVQIPSLRRLGFHFHFHIDWSDPGLRRILELMGPALLGSAAIQINVMVNTNLASRIPGDGPVSWLQYAFRFMQLPLGLFGVAIASATLPSISRSVGDGNIDEFRRTVAHSLGMVFLFTLPSSIGLAVLGRTMIGAIYQGGHFHANDTNQTAIALACYAIGLTGYSAMKVLNPAFYALHDAHTPMWIGLASIAINLAIALTLLRVFGLGHAGLALSTSAVAVAGAGALFVVLRNRLGGIHGRALFSSFWRIGIASLCMGAVALASSHGIETAFGEGRLARLADLAVSIPLSVAVFYSLCRLLRVDELALATRSFLAPLRRRSEAL